MFNNTANKYNIMIIEDNDDNIELIKIYLDQINESTIIGAVAKNVIEAQSYFETCNPDILITDIKLGSHTIFDILDYLTLGNTQLIFTSAFTEFGLKAIEYQPSGYLLKPFTLNEFSHVLKKAIFKLNEKISFKKPMVQQKSNSRIAIASLDKIDLIHLSDIIYIEADGRYSHFHLTNGKITASKNLGSYENQLKLYSFHRIHAKYMVNLACIKSIHKDSGNYCILDNKINLPIARRRMESLMNIFVK